MKPTSTTPTEQGEDRTQVEWHHGIDHGDELALRQLAADIGCGIPYGCQPSVGKWYAAALGRVLDQLLPLDPDVSRRMNRWREHLGDDPLDGFGGRGPAEYHYMATHEPEGPGLTRFGNLQLPDDPGSRSFADRPTQPQPRGEGDDLAARLEARADNADKMAAEVARNPSNYGESGPRHHARLLAAAYAFRKAAEMARASTSRNSGSAATTGNGCSGSPATSSIGMSSRIQPRPTPAPP